MKTGWDKAERTARQGHHKDEVYQAGLRNKVAERATLYGIRRRNFAP
jgi:hypothetical protein